MILRRLSRPCRGQSSGGLLANQLVILAARLANDANDALEEPARVIVFPLVKPERLLIQVSEQMKRFNADIGSANPALEQAPEVFQPVGVDVAANVFRAWSIASCA